MPDLTYLASPYSHPDSAIREGRFRRVCEYAAKLMARGWFVFSPIAHTHPMAVYGELPPGFDFWEAYDVAMIARCQELHVLTLDGWKESRGVTREIEIAETAGIPVTYSW